MHQTVSRADKHSSTVERGPTHLQNTTLAKMLLAETRRTVVTAGVGTRNACTRWKQLHASRPPAAYGLWRAGIMKRSRSCAGEWNPRARRFLFFFHTGDCAVCVLFGFTAKSKGLRHVPVGIVGTVPLQAAFLIRKTLPGFVRFFIVRPFVRSMLASQSVGYTPSPRHHKKKHMGVGGNSILTRDPLTTTLFTPSRARRPMSLLSTGAYRPIPPHS